MKIYKIIKDNFSHAHKPHGSWEGQITFGSDEPDQFGDVVCHKPFGEAGNLVGSEKSFEQVPFLGKDPMSLETAQIEIYSRGDYVSYEAATKDKATKNAGLSYGYTTTMDVILAMEAVCDKFGIDECNVKVTLNEKLTFECRLDQLYSFINSCFEKQHTNP